MSRQSSSTSWMQRSLEEQGCRSTSREELQRFWGCQRRVYGIRVEYFPRVHIVAALRQNQQSSEFFRTITRNFHRKNSLHVNVQWHLLWKERQQRTMFKGCRLCENVRKKIWNWSMVFHWTRFWEKVTCYLSLKEVKIQGKIKVLSNIDCVPSNVQSRIKKLCCMCLKTMKQWSRRSLNEGVQQWDMFPGPTELCLIGCSIEIIWTHKSTSSTSTRKKHLADILTRGNFKRDEWIHLLCLFNFSRFSSTVWSDTMAKRSQHDSGEERVTAKSRPIMNLIASAPSHVSSSISVVQLLKRSDQGDLISA